MLIVDLLKDVRVLDLTSFLSGPLCTQLLVALGAEVIKIERPGGGDGARRTPPYLGPDGPTAARRDEADHSLSVLKRNRGKRSMTLNLAHPRGRDVFRRLVADSDVVVENLTPGALDRLGLGYSVLREWKPDIILCSISGFGQDGPLSRMPSFDLTLQALSGAPFVNGDEGGPPIRSGILLGDQLGAVYGALAIVSALRARDRTGVGEHIDVSLLDALLATMWDEPYDYYLDQSLPVRMGNRIQRFAPSDFYATADGYVAIMVGNDQQWQNLLQAMGQSPDPELAIMDQRLARREQVEELVQSWTSRQSTQQVLAALEGMGVPHAPVLDVLEAAEQQQVAARGLFTRLRYADGTPSDYRAPNFPVRFQRPTTPAPPAPACGAHTVEILTGLAGLSAAEVAELRRQGVI